jgi:hypothetical protein
LGDETLARFRQSDSHEARVYQFARVAGWNDQVCISFFYRASFRGAMLYIENHARVLQPVEVKYREVDNLTVPKNTAKFGMFLLSTVGAPFVCIANCIQLLTFASTHSEADKSATAQRDKIEEQARFNYGTISSLRESVAASVYDHFFEKSDRDLYVKALQKQLLDSIIDFLDSRNVDTSDLRDQRSYIINSGLIVHGDLQASAVAVGEAAKANTRSVNSSKSDQPAAAGGAKA